MSILNPFGPPAASQALPEAGRCPEAVRAPIGGYHRCHATASHPGPHHVAGISWTGRLGDGTMRLSLCTDLCTDLCPADEAEFWGGPPPSSAVIEKQIRQRRKTGLRLPP